jgi:hypothetical protein
MRLSPFLRHGRNDVQPGMIAAIQTFGQLLHWHPHVHTLVTCGARTSEGERLVQYMTRCPFSLSRLVRVTETGQVVYKAEKDACRALPAPQGDGLASGPKRNFQILDPLDFLAEFTQHIPPQGLAPDPVLWLLLEQNRGSLWFVASLSATPATC